MIRSIASRSRTSSSSSSRGERVELHAVGEDQLRRRPAGLLDQVLALLVAEPQGRLGERTSPSGERPTPAVPIAKSWTIEWAMSATRRKVVGGAGRDRAEHELLGDAAAQQHRHVVDQLLARLQVAVLRGQVERVAERAAARHDRDPVDAVDRRQQLAAERVAGLVVGDDAASRAR